MIRDHWQTNSITNNNWQQLWQETTDTLNDNNDINEYILRGK